jgi:hypothetical protein
VKAEREWRDDMVVSKRRQPDLEGARVDGGKLVGVVLELYLLNGALRGHI